MYTFDNESNIIDCFQTDVGNSSVYFPTETDGAIHAFESINKPENWARWTNNASKTAIPPDFYCDDFHLMMEVMRIDDHAHKNHKDKVVNPSLAHEKEMLREIQDSGLLELMPNVTNIFCNGHTGLPTREDHNYGYYLDNFIRVVKGHQTKVAAYRNNHPGYKLIFLLFDESTAYMQAENEMTAKEDNYVGKVMRGTLHSFWADSAFIQAIRHCGADYFVWFAPFKLINTDVGMIPLPRACVYDVKSFSVETCLYNEKLMVSNEL